MFLFLMNFKKTNLIHLIFKNVFSAIVLFKKLCLFLKYKNTLHMFARKGAIMIAFSFRSMAYLNFHVCGVGKG